MAGVLFHMQSGEVSLVAATTKTVIEAVAASNHRVLIRGVEIFFKGTSPTDTPVKVEVTRITTTGTGTAGTIVKNNPGDDETIEASFEFNSTVEPTYTANSTLKTWDIHPQTGLVIYFPTDQPIVIPGGGLLGVKCTAAENQTVSLNLICEE